MSTKSPKVESTLRPYSQGVKIEEIVIVIAAQRNNPSILNPDFLIRKKIVPDDWLLEQPPICVESFSQVVYRNKIKITADFDKLIFAELLENHDPTKLKIAEMVSKYVMALPEVDYIGVGINPSGILLFENDENAAGKFLVENLICPGPWSQYGNAPVRVALRFVYSLENCQLVLSIEDHQQAPASLLRFKANFHHEISNIPRSKKLGVLKKTILNWASDIETYIDLVDNTFMRTEK